eukprot:1727644-Ditylum_brightwellii.AAC.1
MNVTTANNKAQHPSHHQRLEQPTPTPTKQTKHNNQQLKEILGGKATPFSTHNLYAGKQLGFWQLPRIPKTAAIAFCHFDY